MSEGDPLLAKTIPKLSAGLLARAHQLPLQELYAKLNTSAEGLSHREAAARRESASGLNVVPSPVKCPSWMCCLMPCVLNFESVKAFNEVIPEHALVKRDRVFILLDSSSIVPGDVVHMKEGDYAPADLRVIKVFDCATQSYQSLLMNYILFVFAYCDFRLERMGHACSTLLH